MTETADPKTLEPLNVFVGERSMATSFASNAADARVYVHQCSAAEREVPWIVMYHLRPANPYCS